MAQGSDLRVLFGALAGVGLGGLVLLTVLPALVPMEHPRPVPVAVPAAAPPEAPPEAAAPREAGPAPRFDTVRVAPDGSGLVAGQAAPGGTIAVLAGEEVAAEVTADEDGRFVAFLELPPSAEPRALSLRDAAGAVSEETVIVAPTDGVEIASGVTPSEVEGAPPGVAGPAEPMPADAAEVAAAEEASAARDLPSEEGATPGLARVGEDAPTPGAGEGGASDAAPSTEADRAGTQIASAEPEADGPLDGVLGPGSPAPLGSGGTEEPGPAGDEAVTGTMLGIDGTGPALAAGSLGEAGPAALPDAAVPPGAEARDGSTPGAGADLSAAAAPDAALPARAPEVAEGPGGLAAPEGGVPGQAAVLLSDAEGVRVLQPALAPGADAETLATVALDAITYGGEGEVMLAGRASGGGTVRLYLDNAPLAEAPVGPDGQWSATLPGTAPGDYTLRVDQVDAAGEVASRIETPFRREARDELAALMSTAQRPGQTIAVRTVQPGNTLWAIARERYGQPLMYVQVFEMNRDRIRDPDLIYPGQVFVLPATEGR